MNAGPAFVLGFIVGIAGTFLIVHILKKDLLELRASLVTAADVRRWLLTFHRAEELRLRTRDVLNKLHADHG